MKSIALILTLVVLTSAQKPRNTNRDKDRDTVITRSEFDNDGETFSWVSELSDGSSHQQSGRAIDVGKKEPGIVITGSYSFVADDGQTYTVNYVADETGFHPTGAHLPGNAANAALPVRSAVPSATRKSAAKRF